jgi:hypothetical protein
MNPEQHVLDDIDALIADQMAEGEPWDDEAKDEWCRCGTPWHGLAIKGCPGSTTEGPRERLVCAHDDWDGEGWWEDDFLDREDIPAWCLEANGYSSDLNAALDAPSVGLMQVLTDAWAANPTWVMPSSELHTRWTQALGELSNINLPYSATFDAATRTLDIHVTRPLANELVNITIVPAATEETRDLA